jgi:glycosyltransferase involved in cell wall biosynthesis
MLVLPTLMDTSPNVIPEAQIVGVPVVATNVGGIPEMIDDGRTGVLVPPNSADALAAAIVENLRNPDAAMVRARVAKAEAIPEYAAEMQVRKLVDVYRSILTERTIV